MTNLAPPSKPDAAAEPSEKPDGEANPIKAFARMALNSGMLSGKTPLERVKERKQEEDKKKEVPQMMYETCLDFNP